MHIHAHETIVCIRRNLQRGDVSTGWSMGWKVKGWARLLDGNHAYKLIQNQLTPVGTFKEGGGTYNNLFDAHAPFRIDGNFATPIVSPKPLVADNTIPQTLLHDLSTMPGKTYVLTAKE